MKMKIIFMILVIVLYYSVDCSSIKFGRNLSYATVSDSTDNTVFWPKVASLNDQGYVVIWYSNYEDVVGQIFNLTGNKVGTNILIRRESTCNKAASVVGTSTGIFYVSLSDHNFHCSVADTTQNYLRILKFSSDGTKDSSEASFGFGASFAKWTSIAVLTDGNISFCAIVSTNQLYFGIYDSTLSNLLYNNCQACTTDSRNRCEVVGLSNANSLIVWDAIRDTVNYGIFATVLNNIGESQANLLPSENLLTDQKNPSVAFLTNGGIVFTWDGKLEGNWIVYARIYDSTYTAIGNEFQVTLLNHTEEHYASVTSLSNGAFIIAFGNYAENSEIFIKEYNSTGTAVFSPEIIANTYSAGDQKYPFIKSVINERYVIAYVSGTDYQVLIDKASDIENPNCDDFSVRIDKDTPTLINFSSKISSKVVTASNINIKIKTLPSDGSLINSSDDSILVVDSTYENNQIKYSPSTSASASFTYNSIDNFNRQSKLICTVTIKICYQSCEDCTAIGDSTDHKCSSCASTYYAPTDNTSQCFISTTILVGYYFNTDKFSKCSSNCLACSSNTVCTNCKESYFINSEGDIKNCSPCKENCKNCVEQEKCSVCNTGLYLHLVDFDCYSSCPESYFQDNSTTAPQCSQCVQNCKVCSNSSECTTCLDSFYFHSADKKCYSKCPDGFYGDPSDMLCKACPNGCATCTNSTTCTTCISNYYFLTNGCLSNCPDKFYKDEINMICINCTSNCSICTNGNSCTTCDTGYFNNNADGKCYQTCPSRFYGDTTNYTCKACISDCIGCSNSTECTKCDSGYFLNTFNKQCFQTCPSRYYGDSNDYTCKACITNCLTCSNTTVCTNCDSGYFNNSYDGKCYQTCPIRFYGDSSNYTCKACISNCLACSNTTECTTCESGYFFHSVDKKCYQTCPIGFYGNYSNYTCNACISNCIECSNTTECIKCGSNFYLNSVDKKCVSSCSTGLYLDIMNKICKVCPSTCSVCSNETTCSVCKTNHFLFDNFCTNSCPNGFYRDSSALTCKACPVNCKECTSTQCTTCNDSFFLYNLDNVCYQTCPSTYYGNTISKLCESCISNCLTCSNSTECLKCASNLFIDSVTKQCVSSCAAGFYLDASVQTCKACPNTCTTCSDITFCSACKTNYFLYQNTCISSCPDHYFLDSGTSCLDCPENCKICSNATQCTTCNDGYFLYSLNKICYQICPKGFYGNSETKSCQTCITNCAECSNGTDCSKCSDGFLLNTETKQCITSCPTGFFLDIINKKCINCPVYYLEGTTTCVNECPITYYLDQTAKTCRKCISNCDNCNNGTECILCSLDYFNSNKEECKTTFNGYYGNQENRKWTVCPNTCTICSSATECSACITNYFLLNDNPNQCGTCPSAYYGDSLTKKCEACITNCKSCQNNTECIECNEGFITFEKQCLATCPDGYYYNENISNCSQCNSLCSKCKNNSDYCIQCSATAYSFTQNIPFDGIFSQCLAICPDKYYPDENKECKVCKNQWKFLMNNGCVDICNEGYYKNMESYECVQCNQSNDYKYLDTCVKECPNNYVIFANNVCIKNIDCPAGYFIETQTRKCIPCPIYYLDGTNTCVNTCPLTYYLDNSNKICKKCPNNCDLCLNGTECNFCSSNYYNFNIDECKATLDGFYGIKETRKWSPCPQKCKACPNSTDCSICFTPFFLLPEKFTVCGTCPYKYYGDSSSYRCERCVTNCEACDNNRECLTCSNGFIKFEKLCLSACMDGFYENKELSTCSKCKNVCAKCKNDSDYCIECADKTFTFLQTNPNDGIYTQCVTSCPDKHYPDQNNECKTCKNQGKFLMNDHCAEECDQGYYKNLETKECTLCDQPNKYKYEGLCVNSCPENYIVDYKKDCTPLLCNNECKNGGICYVKDNKINCSCPRIYTGEFCEIELPITIDKIDSEQPLTTKTIQYISDLKSSLESDPSSIDTEQTKKVTDITLKQIEMVDSGKIDADPEILKVLSTSLSLNEAAIKTNKIEIKETIPKLKGNTSKLVDSIVKNNKMNFETTYTYKSSEFSVVLTESLQKNIQKMNEEAIINQLVIVNATECEQAIKAKHNLPSSLSLIVKKLDFNSTFELNDDDKRINSDSLIYEFFDQNTKSKYDVDVCKDANVKVSAPLPKNFLNFNTYKKLRSSHLDMLDRKSEAFQDQCIYVKDPNTGKDTTVNYRIKNYYLNRTVECETNCEYGGVDDNGYVVCNCKGLNDKEGIAHSLVKSSINLKEFELKKNILMCFQEVIKFPDALSNPGFFIGFIIIVLGLIFYSINCGESEDLIVSRLDDIIKYDCRYVESENTEIKDFLGRKQVLSNDPNKNTSFNNENKIGISGNFGFEEKTQIVQDKTDLTIPVNAHVHANKSYVDKSEFIEDSIRTRTGLNSNKNNNDKKKLIKGKGKSSLVEDKEKLEKEKYAQNENFNSRKNLQNNIEELNSKAMITKKDYNSLSPFKAIESDNRKFFTMLFDYFVEEHVIFRLIFKKSLLNPSSIEIILLSFRIFVMFGFNAVLFTDSYIDKRTEISEDEGISVSFTREVVKTTLALIFSILLSALFSVFTFVPKKNQDHLNNALISNKKNSVMKSFKKLEERMSCKYTFLIMITYALNLFFWAYMISFCGVFPSIASGWIYGSFSTLILDWFGVSILVPFTRTILRISMKKVRFLANIEYLFWITKKFRR